VAVAVVHKENKEAWLKIHSLGMVVVVVVGIVAVTSVDKVVVVGKSVGMPVGIVAGMVVDMAVGTAVETVRMGTERVETFVGRMGKVVGMGVE